MNTTDDTNEQQAIFVFKAGRYVSTIFYVWPAKDKSGIRADYFAVVYSDDPDRKLWTLRLRMRYYGHGDHKKILSANKKTTESAAVRDMRSALIKLSNDLHTTYEEIPVQAEGAEKPMAILRQQPWVKSYPSPNTVRH